MNRICALLFLACLPSTGWADDWRQFRGPKANGHAACRLPTEWSESQNLLWKVPVAGKGHSSPVIANGQIWLTTGISSTLSPEERAAKLAGQQNPKIMNLVGDLSLRAICFEQETGKLLHDVEVFAPEMPEPIHQTNTYASPTPVLIDGMVLVHFGTYGTAAISTSDGKVVWRNEELKAAHSNGPGSSPVLWDNLLIAHFDGTDKQYLAAINVKDGSIAWQTDRSGDLREQPELKKAYATPYLFAGEHGPELISPAADWVYGYDPSNGSELWKASYGELGFSTVPCPVVGHGMTYICTSFMKSRLLALKLGGRGNLTKQIVWTADSQVPSKPSLLLVGDELYAVNDKGIMVCWDAHDGTEIWRARLSGNFAASPVYSDGKIYCFDQAGKTTIVAAGREFNKLSVSELDEGCNASPAVVDERLYLRTDSHLYCIAKE